jgi:hypothetical protein
MPTPKRRVKLTVPPPTIAATQQAEWDAAADRTRERLAALMGRSVVYGKKGGSNAES